MSPDPSPKGESDTDLNHGLGEKYLKNNYKIFLSESLPIFSTQCFHSVTLFLEEIRANVWRQNIEVSALWLRECQHLVGRL